MVKRLHKVALQSNAGVFFQHPDDLELTARLELVQAGVSITITNGPGVDTCYFASMPVPHVQLSF